MADKPLWGAPPQPGDFVEGALFLFLYIPDGGDAGDGTPITVQCNAYAYQPPHAIDWGDGSRGGAAAVAGVATTTIGTPNLTAVVPLSGWEDGMAITGPGIPAGTTIVSGAGTAAMVMSQNATASAAGVAIAGSSYSFTEDYPPSGGAPGLWTAEHDYKANGNIHRGYVEAGVRAHFNVMVGHARIIDPEDRDKNQNELYAEARADMREARDQQRVRVGRVN